MFFAFDFIVSLRAVMHLKLKGLNSRRYQGSRRGVRDPSAYEENKTRSLCTL